MIRKVSRRGFLKGVAAGGLLLALGTVTRSEAAETHGALGPLPRVPHDPWVWLAIAPDGTVTIVVARSEMGQGTRSTLAAAIADELEADIARVRVVAAEGDEARYGSQNTDGSRSIRMDLHKLREVGAAARQMLAQAGARRMRVPLDEVVAVQHRVWHRESGQHVGYGELATAAFKEAVPPRVRIKSTAQLRYLGQPEMPSFDLDDMVTGRAVFGADVRVPDALVAVVLRPPVYGGRVRSVDDTRARAVPGVVAVLRLPDGHVPGGFRPLGGVAVVARHTWAALRGRDALQVQWEDGPHAVYDSATYEKELAALAAAPAKTVRSEGDWDKARREAARVVEASYHVPHLAQAPMEPPVALAHYAEGRCEIWAPSQHPQEARNTVASLLGLPIERVRVHVTLLGGGFGRKSKPDFIAEAAWLSREVRKPVRVQWTREDDLRHGYYHSVSTQNLAATLNAQGQITGWQQRTVFPSIATTFAPMLALRLVMNRPVDVELGMGLVDFPYAIPNVQMEAALAEPHVRIGWYRAVANLQHAFSINAFLAQLAHETGRDHRALLLELLGADRQFEAPRWNYDDPTGGHPVDTARLKRVLNLVCDKAGWGRALPKGEGLGLAIHRSFLSYAAVVVHAKVGPKGELQLPRVDAALDCGFIANPDRVRAQLEGSVVMGLSNALHGMITFRAGQAEQDNFHTYPVLRCDETPRTIATHLVASDAPAGGVGEAGVPPVGPALCNAIFAATGVPIRRWPVMEQLRKST